MPRRNGYDRRRRAWPPLVAERELRRRFAVLFTLPRR
jgi:hypothetical protein